MGEKTAIQWAHHTFNPWRGCSHALFPDGTEHPGCRNCYAEVSTPVRVMGQGWGPGASRIVAAESTWAKPMEWARAAAKAGERRRVFFSLGDSLDEEAPKDAQARLWQLIRETAWRWVVPSGEGWSLDPDDQGAQRAGLDWLLLTKRPERWDLIPADVRPLVWLGTSISDQATTREWVPRLLAAEGFRRRFLSVEPLVGAVDLSAFIGGAYVGLPGDEVHENYNFGLDWVIVGGESGSHARPCDVAWIRSLVAQCRAAGVPCFVKQLGARPVRAPGMKPLSLKHAKGGDPAEWPEDLRVREMPSRGEP